MIRIIEPQQSQAQQRAARDIKWLSGQLRRVLAALSLALGFRRVRQVHDGNGNGTGRCNHLLRAAFDRRKARAQDVVTPNDRAYTSLQSRYIEGTGDLDR